MAVKILINGEMQDTVSFHDRGLHYGDGLFETIAVAENKPLCLGEHFARLRLGCERLNLPMPDVEKLREEIAFLLDSNQKAVIKIILTRGQSGRGYAFPEHTVPCRIVALYPWPEYLADNSKNGICVRLCRYRYGINPALAGIKHLNRLEQIMARAEWHNPAVTEGLVMDINGNIIGGTMSNLFITEGNDLITPAITECGIAGIVREKIIALSSTLNLKVSQNKISGEQLLQASEIFICNSLIGVWPVRRIENQVLSPGPVTRRVQQMLEAEHCIAGL